MNLLSLIQEKRSEFQALCKSHNVEKLYAFGSSVSAHFDPGRSDIDLVVKVDVSDPSERGEALLSLWDKLEVFFNRKVDLLTEDSIKNPYLKDNIVRTRKLIYDRAGEKIFV